MSHFQNWIDTYKEGNNWEQLFNEGTINSGNTYYKAPKYHNLPDAMQFRIFYYFMNEVSIIEFVTPTYPSAIIENGLRLLNHAIKVSKK